MVPPLEQHVAVVGELRHGVDVVCRHDHGAAALGLLAHDRDQLVAARRVEALERLVEDEQLGAHHQRAGQGDLALLAAGEVVRDAPRQVLDAEAGERLLDHLADLCLRHTVLPRGEGDVVEHAGGQYLLVDVLQHDTDPLADTLPFASGIHTKDAHQAFLAAKQPQEVVEQRRLARAVRAQNGHALALVRDDVQTAQRDLGAVFVAVAHAAYTRHLVERGVQELVGVGVGMRVHHGWSFRSTPRSRATGSAASETASGTHA